MRLRSSCALIVFLVAPPVHAQRPTNRPAAVEAEFSEARATCRESGGTARFETGGGKDEPAFETRIDLNGDGKEDYILDYTGLSCDSRSGDFINPGLCGSAGCPLAIFVSGPGGYRAAPVGHVQGWEINRATNPPRLRLGLHGSACGQVGADTCYQDWGWNGRAFARLGSAGSGASSTVAQGGPARGWTQSTGRNGYRVASIRDLPPPVAGVAITCERNVPMVMMNLGRRAGRTVNVGFATRGGRAEITLVPVVAAGGWAGPIRDMRMLDLLSGPDGQAQVTIAGQAAGAIPLAGSSQAIREALAGCYRPAAAASAVSQRSAATGPLAGAEAFIDNLYRTEPGRDAYTPELAALEERWYAAFDRSGEEGEPTDPFCDAPACGGMRLVSRSVRALPGGRAEALVRYDFRDDPASTPAASSRFVLERTPSGWRIADIIGPEGSYAAMLRQGIAEMGRGRGRSR